jgi:hypothetical protein
MLTGMKTSFQFIISRKFLFLLIISIFLVGCESVKSLVLEDYHPNLVQNPGFEIVDHQPKNWTADQWIYQSFFSIDSKVKHRGRNSALIDSSGEPNDARWNQTIPVWPNRNYVLSGWIKTEGVKGEQKNYVVGANLCLFGTWEHTVGLLGDNKWTYVKLEFNSKDRSEVTIGCRLGYWSGATTGKAWFDDIKLIEKEVERR